MDGELRPPLDLEALRGAAAPYDRDRAVEELVEQAASAYRDEIPGCELVSFLDGCGFEYLFDLAGAYSPAAPEPRVVCGWGASRPPAASRPTSRLRGFPLPPRLGGGYDRGHLFSHAGGGGTDVNLIAQARALNRGWSAQGRRWRALERQAVSRPDATLLIALLYGDDSAVPSALQAALLGPDGLLADELLINR